MQKIEIQNICLQQLFDLSFALDLALAFVSFFSGLRVNGTKGVGFGGCFLLLEELKPDVILNCEVMRAGEQGTLGYGHTL